MYVFLCAYVFEIKMEESGKVCVCVRYVYGYVCGLYKSKLTFYLFCFLYKLGKKKFCSFSFFLLFYVFLTISEKKYILNMSSLPLTEKEEQNKAKQKNPFLFFRFFLEIISLSFFQNLKN